MENEITDLVFILDRSSSMDGLEGETIKGFNSMLKKQRMPARVTTVLFDDKIEELYYRKEICDIKEMTGDEYYVRGCTALLDAIGKTIYKIIISQKKDKIKLENVVFVIVTDGLENASLEYTYASVKKLIQKQKEAGWEFLFLGANMDAIREAANIGIASDRSVTFYNDSVGVALNYKAIGEVLDILLMKKVTVGLWKHDIEDYYIRSTSL